MTTWSFGPEPFVIAGPCVLESNGVPEQVAERLGAVSRRVGLPLCFKASFDKANRSSVGSYRGPGLDEGLRQLERIRSECGLPVLTDVHEAAQVRAVAEVVDVLQIPAFLCRQTDLLLAVGKTGLPVNIKKGQWAAPATMAGAVDKVRAGGAEQVAVTERGTFFGYDDLVVDMRSFDRIRTLSQAAVIFDATHSCQRPGQPAETHGSVAHLPALMRAALVAGADGLFLETHPDPARAPSDRATQWPLDAVESLLTEAASLWAWMRDHGA